jgi:hypothetical protein
MKKAVWRLSSIEFKMLEGAFNIMEGTFLEKCRRVPFSIGY